MHWVVPFLLSCILRDVSFAEVGSVCRVALREPMHLCTCVSEEGGEGLVRVAFFETLGSKTKTIYGCRCDESLKTKVEESTLLGCTKLCAELEHLKIETRLI